MGFEPGTKLGPYVIRAFIDAGGMGEVYRALDPRLERDVAIKVLPAGLAKQEEFRRRFKRETQAISRLNHKNICTIFDTGTYEGRPYIVMELMEGETLERILAAGSVDLEMVLHIGIQVANALDVAHGEGIIHRDIKSANVFVNTRGDAKVLDFGIAKMVQSEIDKGTDGSSRITADRYPLGTVAYMSPEQARGEEVDAKTDIFSLGVVLHEMATGTVPFRGTPTSVLAQLVSPDPIPNPRSLSPSLPPDLERIICRALEKDSRVRYQTAADFLADLRRLRRDLFLRRVPDDTDSVSISNLVERGKGRTRSGRLKIAAWSALSVLVVAAVATQVLSPSPERIESIAVLPCVGQTLTGETQHSCNTVAWRLIEALSQVSRDLDVTSYHMVSPFSEDTRGVFEIGRELRVDAIAALQINQEIGGMNVDVEVSNVQTGTHVWGGSIPLGSSGIQGSLMEIASNLADQIHLELSETDREIWNLEQKVLEAEYQWKLRQAPNLVRALSLYQEVIQADPQVARAHSGLAITYILSHYYGTMSPSEAYPRAREAAERAIDLDPTLADAHAALGLVYRDHYRQFPRAELEFTRALEIDAQSVSALQWYAEHLAITGQFDRAIEYIRRAELGDPLQVAVRAVHGWILVCAGRFEEADGKLREALNMDDEDPLATWFMGQLQFARGEFDQAATTLARAAELNGNQSRILADEASALAMAGNGERARNLLRSLGEGPDSGGNVSRYETAIVYAALGEHDLAVHELEEALGEGTWQVANMAVDPMLAPLHDDPRFPEILVKVGLPDVVVGNE